VFIKYELCGLLDFAAIDIVSLCLFLCCLLKFSTTSLTCAPISSWLKFRKEVVEWKFDKQLAFLAPNTRFSEFVILAAELFLSVGMQL
jgi:hypothetical protein